MNSALFDSLSRGGWVWSFRQKEFHHQIGKTSKETNKQRMSRVKILKLVLFSEAYQFWHCHFVTVTFVSQFSHLFNGIIIVSTSQPCEN